MGSQIPRQTPADLWHERRIINVFGSHFRGAFKDCRPVKMGDQDRQDFAIVRSDRSVRGYVEVKRRTCTVDQWGREYMLAEEKVQSLATLQERSGVKVIVLVEWADALGWIDAVTFRDKGRYAMGGRYDRKGKDGKRDKGDREPCVYIPSREHFTFLLPPPPRRAARRGA